jgi:hypothetical protein
MEDLAEQVKAGNLNFDVVIASPDAMRVVGSLGQILRPRGSCRTPRSAPSPPTWPRRCATPRRARCSTARQGRHHHATIGRASFQPDALQNNLRALIEALQRAKPGHQQGHLLRKVAVSSTMGIGVRVDTTSLAAQAGAQAEAAGPSRRGEEAREAGNEGRGPPGIGGPRRNRTLGVRRTIPSRGWGDGLSKTAAGKGCSTRGPGSRARPPTSIGRPPGRSVRAAQMAVPETGSESRDGCPEASLPVRAHGGAPESVADEVG